MTPLSEEGRRLIGEIASRHGFGTDAAEHLLAALRAGYGSQAQFNHPEFGGMGQWSQGGMTMIGDMFNSGLKARVDGLASELSALVGRSDLFLAPVRHAYSGQSQGQGQGTSLSSQGFGNSSGWWPDFLGQAGSTGAQNDMRYAFFPDSHRLAIEVGGRVTVYDTGDHRIGGFSQQQGGGQSMTLTSQHGLVRIADLAIVDAPVERTPDERPVQHIPVASPDSMINQASTTVPPAPGSRAPEDDIFGKIERLASLYERGILSDQEFQTKKAELLARI
jgi:hypothetical protein